MTQLSSNIASTEESADRRQAMNGAECVQVIPPQSSRPHRSHPYDVVFYTPWVGSILSTRVTLPPGGSETHTLALAKALARQGLRVAIIAYGEPAKLPSVVDGVSIVPRRPYRKIRRLIDRVPETLRIWASLWRAPSRTVVYMGIGSELGVIAIFARLVRRRLVYCSASITDFSAGELEWNRPGLVRRADLFAYGLGMRLAHAIVVQTEEQIPLCRSAFGRVPVLIESIGSPAEPQSHTPEAFLWVGRLSSYKRPFAYIELARALPEAKFWMVGVPQPESADHGLAEAVAKEALAVPNLELLAPRPHAAIEALMERAVASVNTSDFEGMPNVLLEGWSRGVPALVLTFDPGGVVEGHGLGGFAHGSADTLADLAREQWLSRQDRALLSHRCRSYFLTHHAPEVVAAQWHEVLSASNQHRPSSQ